MILLSDHSLPPRQIQLRKIELPKHNYSEQDAKQTLEQVYQQIEEAENQYKKTLEKVKQLKLDAQSEIDQMRDDWQQEKSHYIEQAQQEGYQQGFEQGKKDSIEQYQSLINEAKDVLRQAKEEYHHIIAESDEAVLQIAMGVAEKILYQSLEEDQTKFLPIAKALIDQVKDHPKIKLIVSSSYYPLVIDNKDELQAILHEEMELTIYPSSDLKSEDIMIETPFGRIDASIDSQLEEIRNELARVVEEITRENTTHT